MPSIEQSLRQIGRALRQPAGALHTEQTTDTPRQETFVRNDIAFACWHRAYPCAEMSCPGDSSSKAVTA